MHDEPEKKKKGLKLTRKSTRKIIGKWRKLSSDEGEISLETDGGRIEHKRVLGLCLSEAVIADPSLDGIPLPAFFRHCLDFVEGNGLLTEGIYRLSPPKSRLDELERRANCGESLVFADVHDAAGLIKRFLRQIPEPVVPAEFDLIAESCRCGLPSTSQLCPLLVCVCGAARHMKDALESLSNERRTLFIYVFLHARHVMSEEKENKMGLQALGLLLQTVLEMSRKMVCFCAHAIRPFDDVDHGNEASYLVDKDTRIVKYIPPLAADRVERWLEEDGLQTDRVREELVKQQFLLDLLHSKISARHVRGRTTTELDEHVWQVQNSITAIKRRLKQLVDITPQVVCLETRDSRCIEMYEEKQLMATQGMLREDIDGERLRIAQLCWQLQNVGRLKNDDVEVQEEEEEEEGEEEEQAWKERCKLEEAARSALLEEITRLRSACADLRARLEMESLHKTTPNYDSI